MITQAIPQPAVERSGHGERGRASVRRLDWRFLLPAPPAGGFRQLVLLGGTPALARQAIALGLARQVSLSLPGPRQADALVVLHTAQAGLDHALGCLAPGGVLYCEVDRRRAGWLRSAPGQVLGRLRAAGLAPTGLYWAAPDFEHCRRYIPLDAPAAFGWYLRTCYLAGSPLQRLFARGAGLLAGGDGRRFAPLAPCFGVTAVAGPPDKRPSVLGLANLPLSLASPETRPALLTSGHDDGSRVVMLPFAPGAAEPAAVLKIASLPGLNAGTTNEQQRLAEVRARVAPGLQASIPQPLGQMQYGELAVVVESYAPGRALAVSSAEWQRSPAQALDDLRRATDWLIAFHRQSIVERVRWDQAAIEEWVERPLRAYEQAYGLSTAETRLFSFVRQRARELTGQLFPIVGQHNDYGPWNIYRDGDTLTVIDWEQGRGWGRDDSGPALSDLLYFVSYWIHIVRRLHRAEDEPRGSYDFFVQPNMRDPHVRAVQHALGAYMAQLQLDRRFMPLLLVLLWVGRALHQIDRSRALGKATDQPRAGNRYLAYLAALADHAEQLFSHEPVARLR